MSLGFTKILDIFSSIGISANNFLCEGDSLFNAGDVVSGVWANIVEWFLTVLGNLFYTICQFALTIIDLLQIIVYKFLGITTDVNTFKVYDSNNPLIKFLTNSKLIEIMRTAMIVAVVLVLVFSIFSIIKGEWDKASKDQDYSVKMVWSRAFRSILGMVMFPGVFMAVIILVNALLASFSAALSQNSNTTLGGQVFAICAYDANVYRNYANNNKRIPIYINFQDPYADGTYTRYTTDELASVYDAFATDGKELYNKFATSDFAGFKDTLSYNSNTGSLTNSSSYNNYEKFVCTPEQYQVMADFIDYAMTHNITYYYKPVSDPDIEWKYVHSSIYNQETGVFSITYSDESGLLKDGKQYTVTYQPADYDLGSPIQNAMGTLSTLLSLDGNYYPTLEKINGTINQVAWATNKVHIKLSDKYNQFENGIPAWTLMDQVILYEYYRYQYNNTFEGYSLEDLQEGIYLDAYKIECQYYRSYTGSYVTLKSYDVVIINGTYYLIEEEQQQYDSYGDPYYTLKSGNKKATFLNNFSIYNDEQQNNASGGETGETSSTGTPIGVHIKALDGTNHAKIETNTKTPGGSCGCSNGECNGCGTETISGCGCVKVNTSKTATEVWYSAVYNMQREIPTKCDNVLTNICVADTVGEYAPDGIKITKTDGTVDDNGSPIKLESYGFLNENGFAHEVDRVKATKQVKQVDWAHKLMNDVQNIYRDLNLNQLILTGEWLEVFNSKIEQIGGEYVASFDTSLISPQGLIFSEIFLGIVKESDGSTLSEYMFASKYSQQDKKELVLALCGAKDYETVSITIDYFVEMFNQLFTPLLEKIMANEGQPFKDGEVTNVQLYTYKAYLCSLMLSSDSAGFFSDIANHLSIMYEFPYDIKMTQPGDYTCAVNIIKEYVFSDYVEKTDTKTVTDENGTSTTYTYQKENNIYGEGENLISFGYDMTLFKDDICKYLGENGVVTLASLSKYYDFSDDGTLTIGNIDKDHTPRALLDRLNEKLEESYLSFADIVIRENIKGDCYYGIQLNETTSDESKESTPWGKFVKDQFTKNEVQGQTQGYKLNNSNYHSYKQLPGYDNLCAYIYNLMEQEIKNLNSKSALAQIYSNIEDALNKQNIKEEGLSSLFWPAYLTTFKQYLTGKALTGNIKDVIQLGNNKDLLESSENDSNIIFSSLINKDNADGKVGDYSTYLNKYKSAYTALNNISLLGTFITQYNSAEIITDALNTFIKANPLGYFLDIEIEKESVEDILAFSLLDEIYDGLLNLLADVMSNASNASEKESVLNDFLYNQSGLKDIIDSYYENGETKKLMSKDELLDYSGLIKGKRLESSIEGYQKQQLVAQQLSYIIAYAKNNDKEDNKREHFIGYLQELSTNWSNVTTARQKVLEYHKYFLTYTVRMSSTENASKTFKVNVNNHNYQLNITMPTAKLTEYLLGGKYLNYLGFETVFVDQNYDGFFNLKPDKNGDFNRPKRGECTFGSINNFLSQLADITMKSEYLTNLQNITKLNNDEQKIIFNDNNSNLNTEMAKKILYSILDNKYLSVNTLKKILFNGVGTAELDESKYDEYKELAKLYIKTCPDVKYMFNQIFTYLTGNSKEYSNMTMKELRLDLMEALVNYQKDSSSTTQENKDRYLALFYLFCSDFIQESSQRQSTTANVNTPNAINVKDSLYVRDESTKVLILKLAGIENMPDEMLVGLEYEDVNSVFEGYDEQNGDVFIICTYDEQTGYYIPFLMSGSGTEGDYEKVSVEGETTSWLDQFGYGIAKTLYYAKGAFPVVAKGIITEDGYPTAIRQVDGITQFYRDDLVVRNATKLNLEAYYVNTESISTNYNLFSMITNSISKLVTGKTLVEHAYSGVPKFAIDSSIKLPIGVDESNIALTGSAISMNYNFSDIAGLSSQHFYTTIRINFLIMFIAILALFPILIKAVFGVFGRVIDITLYYSMSPIMFSTIALGKNTKDGEDLPMYNAWYGKLKDKTISVFGYVIGFQVFFIIVDFFSKVEFIGPDAFENIKSLESILPLLQKVGVPVINRMINLVLIICSAYLINEAPQIFADVMGQSNGFKEGETLKNNIKSTVNEVKDVVNGTRAKNTINFAKEAIKDFTGINGIKDTIGEVKKIGSKVATKGMEYYMRAHGVSKKEAKALTKQAHEIVANDVDNKRKLREERRIEAYETYYQQLGLTPNSENAQKLKDIDDDLYKQGLRKRTDKQHKKIQNQRGKQVKDAQKAEKSAKSGK